MINGKRKNRVYSGPSRPFPGTCVGITRFSPAVIAEHPNKLYDIDPRMPRYTRLWLLHSMKPIPVYRSRLYSKTWGSVRGGASVKRGSLPAGDMDSHSILGFLYDSYTYFDCIRVSHSLSPFIPSFLPSPYGSHSSMFFFYLSKYLSRDGGLR